MVLSTGTSPTNQFATNLVHKATAESSRTAPQSQNSSERKSVLKINATGRLVLFADRFIRVRSKSLHLRPLASWHVSYLVDCMLSVGVSTAASSLVCRTRFEFQLYLTTFYRQNRASKLHFTAKTELSVIQFEFVCTAPVSLLAEVVMVRELHNGAEPTQAQLFRLCNHCEKGLSP